MRRKSKNGSPEGERQRKQKKNYEMAVVTYIFSGLFALLAVYFVYFEGVLREDVINNPYNSRQELFAEHVVRGKILASDGTVLAETQVAEDGTESRSYPYGNMFAHVVGYVSHGKSGLELAGNFNLLTSNAYLPERVVRDIKEEKNTGDNLVTTLDMGLQRAAYAALGDNKGAVVAIEPSTGKILCMVSKPDFDPNQIELQWDNWNALDPADSVLYNRASQGLYAPGSVFKIITLLEYFREDSKADDFSFDCAGSLTQGGYTVNCYHREAHGMQSLQKAFANSCNGAFSKVGLQLDMASYAQTCDSLLFGKSLPISLPSSRSSFKLGADASDSEKMMTAIGQGETMVSPLHMALVAASIANKGVLMEPYLIERIENYTGGTVRTFRPKAYGSLMTDVEAAKLTEYMEQVIAEGTAESMRDMSVSIAGKTGSAEFSSDKSKSHAWFVGFSVGGEKGLVVCVLMEDAGSSAKYAVPAARRVFEAYLK